MPEQIEQYMRTLKLGGMAREWRGVEFQSKEQYVRELLELELREREANRINRMVKTAGFQVIKTLDDFVWNQGIELPVGLTREYMEQSQRPQRDNYELVYTAPLPEGTGLNTLWTKFNTDHPPDYRHPSMSVSDVIAVKKNGITTCYYVDQFSFAVLDGFLAQRLRHANLNKPSIKERLAAKPVPGDQPAAKTKNREVR